MAVAYKCASVALLFALLLAAPADGAAVTSLGDTGVRFSITPASYRLREVTVDGAVYRSVEGITAGTVGGEGRPDLPLEGYWIGIPDGAAARVTVESVEYEDVPGPTVKPVPREVPAPRGEGNVNHFEFYRDEGAYRSAAWYPQEVATLGEPGRFRHQRMVPLRIAPFQVVPSTGMLRVYRRIDVRVDFVPGASKEVRPREPIGAEGRWEGVYRGVVTNYDQARSFRSRAAAPGATFRAKALRAEDEYKLSVEEGGLYRIEFDRLAEEGLASGEAVSSIAIYRRGFSRELLDAGEDPFTETSLPTRVIDANGNGLFESGDAIVAFLPGFREDRMKNDTDDRFAYKAVYFLSFEGEAKPFATRPGWRGYPGLDPLVSFPDSIRWEIDVIYDFNPPSDTTDRYFGMGAISTNRLTEIKLPAPDTSVPFAVKARTVSTQDLNGTSLTHKYVLRSEATGDTVLSVTSFGERGQLFPAGAPMSAAALVAGTNQFRFFGTRYTTPSQPFPGAGGYLDWYEVHGNFLYRALGGYLDFSTGDAGGAVQMELDGFADPDVMVLDIGDVYAPVMVEAGSVRQEGGAYTVVLQDSTSVPRRYVAATVEGMRELSSSDIERDTPSDLAGSEGDYLIVTYDDFYDALGDLVDYRSSLGYGVRRARVSDVYDEFNGGVKDPLAIQNYIRYGYERWATPPAWTLLVGDGFEEYKDVATNFDGQAPNNADDFDYVPSYPEYAPVIYGSGDHTDASDLWYGFLDGDADALLDVIVGRFPADDADAVRTMAAKTIAYEDFQPGDAWRARAMFLADDAWTFESALAGCMENRFQTQFESNSRQFSEGLASSAARGIDTVNVFVSRYTDALHGTQSACPCTAPNAPHDANHADVDCVIEHSRELITTRVFNEWNSGVFLVNFEGHGSRTLLTHEIIVRTAADYRNRRSRDIDSLTNNPGRPYIFMAYGCSISEFDRWQSKGVDAMTEEMMQSENGGAVATFGSTGIEFLRPNLALNSSILKYLYQTPGVIPGAASGENPTWFGGVPRWSFGEVVALGLLDFVAVQNENPAVIRRYALFGDPALAVDGSVPAIDMFVDGEPAEEGDVLRGHVDGSPVQLEAHIHDETVIDADSISVYDRDGLVDTSSYTLELDSALAADGRAWVLRYATTVDAVASYDVVVRAVDYNGRSGTFTLTVSVGVTVTFDGESIGAGALVSPTPHLRAVIETPIPVQEDDVVLDIDGAPVAFDSLEQQDENTWVVAASPRLSGGNHELAAGINGQAKTFTFRVDTDFHISELLNYPNPTEDRTGFYYTLTDFAESVELEIFTVNGRKIRHFRGLRGRVGYNENPDLWDGTDQDGDLVAWGVYIYRLTARRGGDRSEAMGKAVRVPPDLPGAAKRGGN